MNGVGRFNSHAQDVAIVPRDDWDRAPWNRWSFQHVREIVPTTQVWRSPGPASLLPFAPQGIDEITFSSDGWLGSIADFFAENYTDAALILHRGKIVAERYLNEMLPRTAHLSQSVAKSVVGTVAGILIGKGLIDPTALVTAYLPELERTAYRGATVRHVLDMTSGVIFDETYTAADSHMAKMDAACGWKRRPDPSWPANVWELVLTLTQAERAHGEAFRYRSIETDILAFVMERASGLRLAELVSQEMWVPMGAEEDAYFTVDSAGYALANGGFNATLRDYGRFALLHLREGELNGQRIVPSAWLEDIRFGGDQALFGDIYRSVLPGGAYRNQFWIEDTERRAYLARGVFGQMIYIDPLADFAAVLLSSWPEFINDARSRMAIAAVKSIRETLTA